MRIYSYMRVPTTENWIFLVLEYKLEYKLLFYADLTVDRFSILKQIGTYFFYCITKNFPKDPQFLSWNPIGPFLNLLYQTSGSGPIAW